MLLASGASIPTIAGTVEEEEEYARSEANSAHYDGYVTDHTDLASEIDIDESEYRRELLNDVRQFIRLLLLLLLDCVCLRIYVKLVGKSVQTCIICKSRYTKYRK